MSDHNWVLENLESYNAGGLNSAERERVEGHLAKCAACAKALQEIRGLDDRLDGLFAASRPEPGLEDRMIRSLRIGGSKTKSRLPVIGWIGLSAAAAVLLGVVGALMQYAVLRAGPPADWKEVFASFEFSALRDKSSQVVTIVDGSGSTTGNDAEQTPPPKNAQYIPSVDGNVDEMASRLGEETIAKVDSGKSVAFSPDGKQLNDTRQIMAGLDEAGVRIWDTGAANGSMGADAKVYSRGRFAGDMFQITDGSSQTMSIQQQDLSHKGKPNGEGWSYQPGGGLGLGGLGGGGGSLGNNGSLQLGYHFGFQAKPATPATAPPTEAPPAAGYYPPSRALGGKEAGKDGQNLTPLATGGVAAIPFEPKYQEARKRLEQAQDIAQRLQKAAETGAMSSLQIEAALKDVEEAKKEVHTYRNAALSTASNEYFRPGAQAKADAENLFKEIDKKTRSQTIEKGNPPAKSDKGVVVGLGNKAGFATGLDIPVGGTQDQKPAKPDTAPAVPRKIVIRSGQIEFEIDSFDSAVATVTLLVTKIQGGFVDTVNSEKLPNGKVRGAVVVRVPPEHLDGLVLELRKELGKSGELKGQKIGSQDITKQYTDLESRLKAARAMEERLLQVIKSGKGEIKDLLAAEKELGVWRTKIEEIEGELRYYASQVALSTLTINLAEKEVSAPSAVIETERIQMGVEVEDVIKAQQQVLKAVEEAKGRVTKSDLKQHAADQLNSLIHFEVAPEKAGPLRDRIEQLGRRTRLEIDRLQETEGGTGKPGEIKTRRKDTQFILSLFNVANVAPRETVQLKLACVDAEDVYKKILARVETAKGRVVTSNLNRQRNEQTSGLVQFEVKSADAGAVLMNVKELGEVIRLQVTENPDKDNVTRSKQGFNVELLALGLVQARETTCIQLATRDVPASYTAIKDAVTKAKGLIAVAQLNEQNKQNITAQLDFEIRRADEAAVSAALTAAGDTFSRNVTRAADADNVVDSKVHWQVSLINQDQIPPRETTTLGIEVNNVDKTAAVFADLASAGKGRTVESHVARERTGRTTAKLIFNVPLSAASSLVEKFKKEGTVRVEQFTKNPQVPESELAVARLDVTLSNSPLIVPSDEGIGPVLRGALSTSMKALFLSLSFLVIGLLVVLPWVLVIYAIFRLIMRMRRKAVTAPTV
jgi:hypothetical protein